MLDGVPFDDLPFDGAGDDALLFETDGRGRRPAAIVDKGDSDEGGDRSCGEPPSPPARRAAPDPRRRALSKNARARSAEDRKARICAVGARVCCVHDGRWGRVDERPTGMMTFLLARMDDGAEELYMPSELALPGEAGADLIPPG